ncbi:hypothetical protein IJ00_07035 [Calothrix sp. 336/3]|nr:hypothetical protein IJ00_07035 [Calothrix sp. 336/3]
MPVGILRFGVWLVVGLLAAVFGHHTSITLFSWGTFSSSWLGLSIVEIAVVRQVCGQNGLRGWFDLVPTTEKLYGK